MKIKQIVKLDLDQLKKDYENGLSVRELAEKHNTSKQTIDRRLNKLNIKIPSTKEIMKNTSKEWILKKYSEGLSAKEIGKLLGVSKRPILDRLKKWKITRSSSEAAAIRMSKPEERKKISKAKMGKMVGSKHPRWKGGVSGVNILVRAMPEYKIWRKTIFERDDYTCQKCQKRGVYLHADHIKPFAVLLKENNIKNVIDARICEILWNLNNGRTLCKSCHKKTDTYAGKIHSSKWKNDL